MSRKDEIIPRIHKAALNEFIENGVAASSMEGIARSAKTTKKTLYKYFPSKEIIFNEIIRLLLERFDAYSNYKYLRGVPVEEQINEIIENKIRLMRDDNYLKTSKLLSIELIKSNPIDSAHYRNFYKSERKFIKWIKDAQEDKKILTNQKAEIIANQFLSIMKGQVFYPVLFGMSRVSKKDVDICRRTVKTFFTNFVVKV